MQIVGMEPGNSSGARQIWARFIENFRQCDWILLQMSKIEFYAIQTLFRRINAKDVKLK